jgi:hypothetical protein
MTGTSGSSYLSLSPDLGRIPILSTFTHSRVRNTAHCLPEYLDEQKTELNYQVAAKTTDNSGHVTQPARATKAISKFHNPPTEDN